MLASQLTSTVTEDGTGGNYFDEDALALTLTQIGSFPAIDKHTHAALRRKQQTNKFGRQAKQTNGLLGPFVPLGLWPSYCSDAYQLIQSVSAISEIQYKNSAFNEISQIRPFVLTNEIYVMATWPLSRFHHHRLEDPFKNGNRFGRVRVITGQQRGR